MAQNLTLPSSAIGRPRGGAVASRTPRMASRRWLGVRSDALLEILAFVAISLVIDRLFGAGHRFIEVTPHPFWIAVLAASAYYGAAEGLAAAAICAAALLLGNLPLQGFNEDFYGWLLRATSQLSQWCVAAVALGAIEQARRRTIAGLRDDLGQTREEARAITEAYDHLNRVKDGLELRVAGQVRTTRSLYQASRAIEQLTVGEVLAGVPALVSAVIGPRKFSLFLCTGTTLQAAISEGWTADERYLRGFDSSAALFDSIVVQRRFLVLAKSAHAPILGDEGMLAGPLVSGETGVVVGMLKIEDLAFRDLHPTNVENFRLLCDWIGTAFAKAQRVQHHMAMAAPEPVQSEPAPFR